MQKSQVQSLGREDPLEKGMATPSSILAWRIPWTEEHGGRQSMGLRRVRHNWATKTHTLKQALTNQAILNSRKSKLYEFQAHVNWEIFTIMLISSVQLLSRVWLLAMPWTEARQAPFPIWNQSVVPCPVLTAASSSAYRFLRRQVRWSGIPIPFRIFHSLLWSTQSKDLA